jgi:hypothetical protein
VISEEFIIVQGNYHMVCRNERAWQEYQDSPEWWLLKNKALKVAHYQCQRDIYGIRCINCDNLDMHHIYYVYDPKDDSLTYVCILCRNCHNIVTRNGFLSIYIDIELQKKLMIDEHNIYHL